MIASSGFASGDRVVVGWWSSTPVGPMADVMWARPDGERVLLAPDQGAAAFITAVYDFDRVEIVDLTAVGDRRTLSLSAGDLDLNLRAGRGVPLPGPRPAWFTRWVEAPVARAVFGVRTYGTSPTGVREWYRADRWMPLAGAAGVLAGTDLGAMGPLTPPLGVGFSEPPRRPSWVRVRPLLHDPTGRLDRVLAEIGDSRR